MLCKREAVATLRECLQSLTGDMVMRDLAAVRDEVAAVSEHIARLRKDATQNR